MKKTVFTLVLVIIGICFALNGSAQNDKVCTLHLKVEDHPDYKVVMTINPSQNLITQKVNDGEARDIYYYDYSFVRIDGINIGNYSFSLVSDMKPPKTEDECWTSEYYLFIGLGGVWLMLEKDTGYVFEYDMTVDEKADQLAILTANLLGLEPKSNSSSSHKTSSSLINVPALPKEMTEIQMVMHPFGVLTNKLDGYTQQQVVKDLTKLFIDHVSTVGTSSVFVHHNNDKGYDMSYQGNIPTTCSCYFSDGKLYSYSYHFPFLKDGYSQEQIISIAKRFAEKLQENGLPLSETSNRDYYNATFKTNDRVISIRVFSNAFYKIDDSWAIDIDIRRR